MHANKEAIWYSDDHARRYRVALAAAQRCFFVSDGNRRLSEKQIGGAYSNAEVVHNPVNISSDVSLAWPPMAPGGTVRFACVGRLYPPAKGQDLLLEALAEPSWRDRPWKLYIYGDGEMRQSLKWLAGTLGISDRVIFAGFASVDDIWTANHVLVMPSRFEGLPLAMVEAMLCARPVVATDIAGHREIIEDGVTGFLADAPTAASISAALDRFWARRGEAEEIGKAGARSIRQLVPPDPSVYCPTSFTQSPRGRERLGLLTCRCKQCRKCVNPRLGQRKHPAIDGHHPAVAKIIPAPFPDCLRKRTRRQAISTPVPHIPKDCPRKTSFRGFDCRQRLQARLTDCPRITQVRPKGRECAGTGHRTNPAAIADQERHAPDEPGRSSADGRRNQAAAAQHGPRLHASCLKRPVGVHTGSVHLVLIHVRQSRRCSIHELAQTAIDLTYVRPIHCPTVCCPLFAARGASVASSPRYRPRSAGAGCLQMASA